MGFLAAEKVAAEQGLVLKKPLFRAYRSTSSRTETGRLWIVEPLTFMNNSGSAARSVMHRTGSGPENLIVVCDNLDLPAGMCRLKRAGKDAGHNGLKSVIAHVGTSDFLRLYIGVGHPEGRTSVVDWVLGVPDDRDAELIGGAVDRAAGAILSLITTPAEQVMNEFNRRS